MNGRTSPPWESLRNELDAWGAAGLTATLWWRDDDVRVHTPELDRLISLSGDFAIPVGLAAIPADAHREIGDVARAHRTVSILQHGYAHQNHEPKTPLDTASSSSDRRARFKTSEFGPARPTKAIASDLERGWRRLITAVPTAIPVFVPPWNRFEPGHHPLLAEAGFRGFSTFRARLSATVAPGVLQVNTHADVIDWRGTRGFAGEHLALTQIVDHLAARRAGNVDPEEPTGVLTHHLDHDEGVWRFLEHLFSFTVDHQAVSWPHCKSIFHLDRS